MGRIRAGEDREQKQRSTEKRETRSQRQNSSWRGGLHISRAVPALDLHMPHVLRRTGPILRVQSSALGTLHSYGCVQPLKKDAVVGWAGLDHPRLEKKKNAQTVTNTPYKGVRTRGYEYSIHRTRTRTSIFVCILVISINSSQTSMKRVAHREASFFCRRG